MSEESDQMLIDSILNRTKSTNEKRNVLNEPSKVSDNNNGVTEETWMMMFTITRYPNGQSFQSQPRMWLKGKKQKVTKKKQPKVKAGQTKILEEENY